MKKLLNTLYITSPGSYLHREGETVSIERDQSTVLRIPIHTLEGIVCYGRAMMSPQLMQLCASQGVTITFLTEHGKFVARVHGHVSGNVLLRRQQYRWADDGEQSAALAQAFVASKIANARSLLVRASRDRPETASRFKCAIETHGRAVEKLLGQKFDLATIRGIEGDAARSYFDVFGSMILGTICGEFPFGGRSRRPPRDAVNALLSFSYSLLTHEVSGALEAVGLDPYVGFLHSDRPGRPSLALDLMEELRPILADRFVLALVNRRQIRSTDFTLEESGAVRLRDDARKEVLQAWQLRKQEMIRHPFLDEKIEWGVVAYSQALLLARHIRGDLDAYPGFVAR